MYHPESKGALEPFYQTLETMLCTYCLEFEKDWDEGVHMHMFTIRELFRSRLGLVHQNWSFLMLYVVP